jgi:signal transduction histidine kinase/CheY-like chemotaxis protein
MRGALTRRDYLLQADLLEFADRPCVLTIANDVTEIRQANQARHALLGAESASQAKTEFLSRMSHELRTPLNAVLGFAQLLQSDPNHPLSAHHQTQVEHIRRAGWHLLTLINDVLDVAKIEAGKTEVEERGVALVDLLDEVMLLNEPAAIEHSVGMTALYRRDARIGVLADPRRLRQVMINLLSNAIKYNRPGGRVTLDIVLRSGQTHIHVEDTGLGMTPEQLAHLYEPFNRLGRERITVEGSGLGLALTRQLVHLMRGQIEITSDAGVGTRVTVSLQTHDAAESLDGSADATPTLSAEASDEDPTGVVLYIEDNPVNLLLVEQFLSRWPRVLLVQAENGTDGIALARTTKPDVILLDMRLPDMEGTDVLAALENFPLTPCRVIALSASAMPEDVKAARLAGAFDYWTKPLNFEQFRVEMARLLHTKP